MVSDRTKLIFSFALLGFLVGSTSYHILNWIMAKSGMGILYLPVPVLAPWFMSGIAGSFFSVISVYAAAYFSRES